MEEVMVKLRCFLSFDLHCHTVIDIPINSSWTTITDKIALQFSNLTASCVESFLIMTGQEKEEELIDTSLQITNEISFWQAFEQFTFSSLKNSEIIVNVKVIACPAYSLPIALADETSLKAVLKLRVDETSWEVVTDLIRLTFQLIGTSLEIEHIALTDLDGDYIGPVITSAAELYKRYSKSFDPNDETMKFLIYFKSRNKQQSDDITSEKGSSKPKDQMFYDSRGNIRIYGVCEKDLSNAAVFHISAGFSWQDIGEAFCKPLSIHGRHLINHFQIWDNQGNCIGPPLDNGEIFLEECKKNYSFDRGMFVAAILKTDSA